MYVPTLRSAELLDEASGLFEEAFEKTLVDKAEKIGFQVETGNGYFFLTDLSRPGPPSMPYRLRGTRELGAFILGQFAARERYT